MVDTHYYFHLTSMKEYIISEGICLHMQVSLITRDDIFKFFVSILFYFKASQNL